MGFGTFLGIFLLLVGVSILLRIFTGINIPLGRIALGVFLIYFGVRVILGSSWNIGWKHERQDREDAHTALFREGNFKPNHTDSSTQDYQIVFGRGTIDLTGLAKFQGEKPDTVEVNVVFGEAVVLLDPTIQTQIHASSVFGEARMPNGDLVAFGSMRHYFPNAAQAPEAISVLKVQGNVVFGSLRFETKPGAN
ncbi:MAG: hypothetical protein A2Z97_02060 [Bdellovibrionales bacterium GWB1_52_6]|nr:MAG: hypothetical protein A2Z97_02060 [Bdellovibrionales bacterium GWB1_52_6]